MVPLIAPDQGGEGKAKSGGGPERPAEIDDRVGDDDAGGADHRADGEVELAGDQQQRDGRADDADHGGDLQVIAGADQGQEAGIAGEHGEDHEHRDGADQRRELGAQQDAFEIEARGGHAPCPGWFCVDGQAITGSSAR